MKRNTEMPKCLMLENDDNVTLIFNVSKNPATRVRPLLSKDLKRLYVMATKEEAGETTEAIWEFDLPPVLNGMAVQISFHDGHRFIRIPKNRSALHAS